MRAVGSEIEPGSWVIFLLVAGVCLAFLRRRKKASSSEPSQLEKRSKGLIALLEETANLTKESQLIAKQPFALAHRLLGELRALDECLHLVVESYLPDEVNGMRRAPEREVRFDGELRMTSFSYHSKDKSIRLTVLLPRRTERVDDAVPDHGLVVDRPPAAIHEHIVAGFNGQLLVFADNSASLVFGLSKRAVVVISALDRDAQLCVKEFAESLPLKTLSAVLLEPNEEPLGDIGSEARMDSDEISENEGLARPQSDETSEVNAA